MAMTEAQRKGAWQWLSPLAADIELFLTRRKHPDPMPIRVRSNAGVAEVHSHRCLQHGNPNLYPLVVALIDNGITHDRNRHLGCSGFRRGCGLHGVPCP